MEKFEITSLVKQAAQGDRAAFGKLYEATGRRIYFTALKLTGSDADAQDVLQDSFMTAFEKLPELSSPENFEPWLMRIAVNRCKMHFRSQKPTADDPEITENIEDGDLIPEDYVMDKAKRRIIMDIIDRELTEEQRRTVILFYFSQLSVEEIASAMDCPKGTVLSRLHLARGKIREAVLIYENKSGDKLHALIPIPVLTRLFEEEAKELSLPGLAAAGTAGTAAAAVAKSGGEVMVNTASTKLIAGIIAGVVAAGGIGTAVVLASRNSDDDSSSGRAASSVVREADSSLTDQDISSVIENSIVENSTVESDASSMLSDDDRNDQTARINAYVDEGQALVDRFFTALKEGDADTILDCLYKPENFKAIKADSPCRDAAMEATKYFFRDLEWDFGGDNYRKTNRTNMKTLDTASKVKSIDFRVSYVARDMHSSMCKYISTLSVGDPVVQIGAKATRDTFYKYADAAASVAPLRSRFSVRLKKDPDGQLKVDADNFLDSAIGVEDNYLWTVYSNTDAHYYSRMATELFDTNNTGTVADSGFIGNSSNQNSCPEENAEVVNFVKDKLFDKAYNYLMTSENPVIKEYLEKYGSPLMNYEKLTDEQKAKVNDFIRSETLLIVSDHTVDKYKTRLVHYELYYNDPVYNAEDYLTFKQSHPSYTSFSWADSFKEGTPKDLFELLQPLDDIAQFADKLQ